MPDIAFHFSSETADANGHCPPGTRTRINLPIEPAIQISNTSKPVCWLHNLNFVNSLANCDDSDDSNSVALTAGDESFTFHNGTGTANSPWIGIKYQVTDADGTPHDMAMVAPADATHGLNDAPYNVSKTVDYPEQPDTMDGRDILNYVELIDNIFHALTSVKYAQDSGQDVVVAGSPTMAFTQGSGASATVKVQPPPLVKHFDYFSFHIGGSPLTVQLGPVGNRDGLNQDVDSSVAMNRMQFQSMTSA